MSGMFFDRCEVGVHGYGTAGAGPSPTFAEVYGSNCTFTECTEDTKESPCSAMDNVIIDLGRIAEWAVGETYAVDDMVSCDGELYKCIQAHTAYSPTWTPPNTPALWMLE